MGKEADKTVLQRKLYNNKDANKDLNKTNEPDSKVEESENMQNTDRIRNVLPVPKEETRQRGREQNVKQQVIKFKKLKIIKRAKKLVTGI